MAQARHIHPLFGDPTQIFAPPPTSSATPAQWGPVPSDPNEAWQDLDHTMKRMVPQNVNNARDSLRRMLAQRR